MRMNPFRWSFRAQLLAAGVVCFALIGFAVFSQDYWGLDPCPLCIFQRLAFAGLGLVLLVAGLHAPRTMSGRRAYGLLSLVAASIGAGISIRHLWIQVFPPPIPACGPPLDFLRETLSAGDLVQRVLVGTGDCSNVDWTFLGLSMPGWALVWFVLLGAWAVQAGFRRRPLSQLSPT